ncbi:MAG: VWA domain-containing protein, partial [Pyrinomonadaceae bacterium]
MFGVKTLRPGDRFNVISFAGEERLMAAGLIQADDQGRARGVEFVEALRPVGGTNINGALLAALRQFDGSDRPRMLVFMTDGLPTVGETNVNRIIENSRSARTAGTRLFTFGVGYDVNTALLDKLAAENGGTADYVEPKEDIEIKVGNFFTKVNYPVLTDLQLDMGGVETDLIYPRAMPDVFRGTQITLIGRYRNPNDLRGVRMRLTGRDGRQTRAFNYDNLRFPLEEGDNEFLPRLWATRRVGWLMEQVRTNGEQKELRDEIVDLGTRYGIVTPYTSYLALEPGAAAVTDNNFTTGTGAGRPTGPLPISGRRVQRGIVRPEARAGGADMSVSAPPPPKEEAAKATTGSIAVRQSKRDRAQQEALREDEDAVLIAKDVARKVGGKTFYLRDDVWTDAEFKPDARLPETRLTFASDDYFALLALYPDLGDAFALGDRV